MMKDNSNLLNINLEATSNKIQQFIRKYVIELRKDGTVIGLSGGIDSCLVLKLCVEALGKENVISVIMPERDSDKKNMSDAIKFAKKLGVKYVYKKITPILQQIGIYNLYPPTFLFKRSIIERFVREKRRKISERLKEDTYIVNLEGNSDPELCKGLAYYRIKHRLRSVILFYYSELKNYLYVGCSNKSEWLTGYFVKYGDNIADIMPIISLYKTQVSNLAKYLDLPSCILEKSPSPDLIPGILDEDMLGMSYRKLDLILFGIENNYTTSKIIEISGATKHDIQRVKKIINKSEYLRTWPIGLLNNSF